MKRTVFLIALILLLAGCTSGTDEAAPEDTPSETRSEEEAETTAASELRTVTIEASGGEAVEVQVEIADDTIEHSRGLMDRTSLGEDRGMLFVFSSEETRSFWMRNTRIPLSIAYIDSEGRIIDLQDMKALDDEEPHYVSAEPAQYALEVNQGFFEERGVEVGDTAELPR